MPSPDQLHFPHQDGNPEQGHLIGGRLLKNITDRLRQDQRFYNHHASGFDDGSMKTEVPENPTLIGLARITKARTDRELAAASLNHDDRTLENAYWSKYRASFIYMDRETGLWLTHGEAIPLDAGGYSQGGVRVGPIPEFEEGETVPAYYHPTNNLLIPIAAKPQQQSTFDARGGTVVGDGSKNINTSTAALATSRARIEWKQPEDDAYTAETDNYIDLEGGPYRASVAIPVKHGTKIRFQAGTKTGGATQTIRNWGIRIWAVGRGWRTGPNFDPTLTNKAGFGGLGTDYGTKDDGDDSSSSQSTAENAATTREAEIAGMIILELQAYAQSRHRYKDEPFAKIDNNGITFDVWGGEDNDLTKYWTLYVEYYVEKPITGSSETATLWIQAPSGGIPPRIGGRPGNATTAIKVIQAPSDGSDYQENDLIKTGAGGVHQISVYNWRRRVVGAEGDRICLVDKHEDGAIVLDDDCNNNGTPSDIKVQQ